MSMELPDIGWILGVIIGAVIVVLFVAYKAAQFVGEFIPLHSAWKSRPLSLSQRRKLREKSMTDSCQILRDEMVSDGQGGQTVKDTHMVAESKCRITPHSSEEVFTEARARGKVRETKVRVELPLGTTVKPRDIIKTPTQQLRVDFLTPHHTDKEAEEAICWVK